MIYSRKLAQNSSIFETRGSSDNNKTPKSFDLYFLIGLGCLCIAIALFVLGKVS